jgi:hypothetical protein
MSDSDPPSGDKEDALRTGEETTDNQLDAGNAVGEYSSGGSVAAGRGLVADSLRRGHEIS